VFVTFARHACLGDCPVYQLTIHTDGVVEYDGEWAVGARGRRTSVLSAAQLAELDKAFDRARFCTLRDRYDQPELSDGPGATTAIFRAGGSKTVVHVNGDLSAPDALGELEERVDRIVGTAQWIHAPPTPRPPARNLCRECLDLNCSGTMQTCRDQGLDALCFDALVACARLAGEERSKCLGLLAARIPPVESHLACFDRCCTAYCR
jgi:hypothetical protein